MNNNESVNHANIDLHYDDLPLKRLASALGNSITAAHRLRNGGINRPATLMQRLLSIPGEIGTRLALSFCAGVRNRRLVVAEPLKPEQLDVDKDGAITINDIDLANVRFGDIDVEDDREIYAARHEGLTDPRKRDELSETNYRGRRHFEEQDERVRLLGTRVR